MLRRYRAVPERNPVDFAASYWSFDAAVDNPRGGAVLLSAQRQDGRAQPFEVTRHRHLTGWCSGLPTWSPQNAVVLADEFRKMGLT